VARTALPGRLASAARGWRLAEVLEARPETPRTTTLAFDVPGWEGHRAGQHVDVRLTAEDGYQAQRSYSIASAPEEPTIALAVERLEDGEVSPYLAAELRAGDEIELRGPIGGYFAWDAGRGERPLFLVGGGSGFVPLMAMLRHRANARDTTPARALVSARTLEDVLYREELERLAGEDPALAVARPSRAPSPRAGRATTAAWTTRCSRRPASGRSRRPTSSSAGPPASSRPSRRRS